MAHGFRAGGIGRNVITRRESGDLGRADVRMGGQQPFDPLLYVAVVAASGVHFSEWFLRGEKRSQGVGDLGVLRDEFVAIYRLAAIDAFMIFTEAAASIRESVDRAGVD